MSILTKRIRTIRNSLHYSQEFMAYKLGISQTAYSYLENNENILTIGRLAKMAHLFNMSLMDLIKEPVDTHTFNQSNPPINGLFIHSNGFSSTPSSIGSRIRQLRKEQRLRQQDMASRLGISQKTYSLLESNHDENQKVGRLKQVAICLSLPDWTNLLSTA